MDQKYVITISRQFGSLGRPIAKRMSEKLGIQFYDRDIVDETAKKLKLPLSIVKENEESATKLVTNTFRRMAYPLGRGTSSVQDDIFATQQNIINFLVDRESCIVVGRCGDYVLSEAENALHIYIYAPYKDRVKNSIEQLGLTELETKQTIAKVDAARDSYHKHYAGFAPDDKNFKDILINSSLLGVEGTAEYLVQAVKQKFNL